MLKSDFSKFALEVGVVGPQGIPGSPGPSGTNGVNGINGVDGTNGANWSPVESTTSPVLMSGDIIVTGGVTSARVAPTATVTGIILAIGTLPGQQVNVLNEGSGSVVMAAAGTSHVANGINAVIPPGTHVQFVWSSSTNLWYLSSALGTPTAPIMATAYTLTGPTGGIVSVPSTNFTVQVSPIGSNVASTVTVTPAVSGVAGSFSPTTVTFGAGVVNASATFTFTPTATGTAVISTTNSASLSNPASISYVVSAGTGTPYGAGAYGSGPFGG